MTDQKNGQEYLSFVLEKLQARLAEISQSLLDGQKEIENARLLLAELYRDGSVRI